MKEYHLTAFQALAVKKFIKTKIGNPDDKSVDRLRAWLFMRLNGHKLPEKYHPRQLGCPDLVPGLPLKGWWEREEIDWVSKLEANFDTIRDELIALREQKGF